MKPSVQPTGSPSMQPTVLPSRQPSTQPSSQPTSPTSQPTSTPTQPTYIPTIEPTVLPTSQPSIQPSSQPSSEPTAPTSQPSSSPTGDSSYSPIITVKMRNKNKPAPLIYYCHPDHLHSTPNAFQKIFYGLNITSRVNLKKMLLWISPYDPVRDRLSLVKSTTFMRGIIMNHSLNSSGFLEITAPTNSSLDESDWSLILNRPSYKLDIMNVRPYECRDYAEEKYPRTIRMRVFDEFDRGSNIVSKVMEIRTAAMIFSNEGTAKITNSQPDVSVVVNPTNGLDSVNFTIQSIIEAS